MNTITADFQARAALAVRTLADRPALVARITAEVDAFFAKHTNLQRTPLTEGFYASLVLEQLTNPADSQSAATHETTTQKVA